MLRFVPVSGRLSGAARSSRSTPARTAFAAVAVLAGALLAVGATASPAAALAVESASPTPGSNVRSAPAQITMRFDQIVFITDFDISVTGPRGDVRDGIPTVFGRNVTQRLDESLPDGRYTVSWNVEGGLLREAGRGSFSFRVGAPPPPAQEDEKQDEGSGDAREATPPAAALPSARPSEAPKEEKASAKPEPTRIPDPVATATTPAKGVPITGAKPTVEVPQSEITGVGTTSAEWLPPPLFWWSLLAAGMAGILVWRRRRNRPVPVVADEGDPEPMPRQTELVLGAGPGLTTPDGPPPMSLTPTQGVPRLSVVPAPATPVAGFEQPVPQAAPAAPGVPTVPVVPVVPVPVVPTAQAVPAAPVGPAAQAAQAEQPEDLFVPHTPPAAVRRVEILPDDEPLRVPLIPARVVQRYDHKRDTAVNAPEYREDWEPAPSMRPR